MSPAIHLVSHGVAGYGLSEGRCLPCSGVSRRAVSISPSLSQCDYKTITQAKIGLLTCNSKGRFYPCKASSGGHRRNPDFFSKQNKQGFSRNRNRPNEERNGSENFDEPEMFSSKNVPLLSLSNTSKFQGTASPGPREREIVELFRKVQAQLRERAAFKEDKKIENLQVKGKESETVDSLLKLLRKHSVQQGKRKSSSGSSSSRDFISDQPDHNVSFDEEKSTSFIDSNNTVKEEALEHEPPSFSRPISNFQRRSPVSRVTYQSISSDENTISKIYVNGKREKTRAEPRIEHEVKLAIEPEPEPEAEATFSDGDVFVGLSEDVISDTEEGYVEDVVEQPEEALIEDLNVMKLSELRAIAKSRGMKGFSKLKKLELLELLRGGISM